MPDQSSQSKVIQISVDFLWDSITACAILDPESYTYDDDEQDDEGGLSPELC